MPRRDMVSIDFSRVLDLRLQAVVPPYLRGNRQTRRRVEYVIAQYVARLNRRKKWRAKATIAHLDEK